MRFWPLRARGFAIVALCFAIAAFESGLLVDADRALPGWDKPVHALCAFGVVLALEPRPGRRRLAAVAAIAIGIAWEAIQFFVDPFQGHEPALYAIDTLTDVLADALGAALAARTTRGISSGLERTAGRPAAERRP